MELINFGCGLSAADGWLNYDASPTLRAQRMSFLGSLAKLLISPRFPDKILYGNIATGLPERSASIDAVYCSHVLEHLSVEEVRLAISEVYRLLKPGRPFRGVLPDLRFEVNMYLQDTSPQRSIAFMERNDIGIVCRPQGIKDRILSSFGNSKHISFWDYESLEHELKANGFKEVRRAFYRDSAYSEFTVVESVDRWTNCLGFEALK